MAGRLCHLSDSLGRPGEGAHAARFAGLAAIDLVLTAGLAWGLALLSARLGGSGRLSLVGVLVAHVLVLMLAVAAHELFCVNTRLNAALFGRPWPSPHPAKLMGRA